MRPWKLTEEREQARLRIQAQVARERQAKQCPHTSAYPMHEHGDTWLECPSCGATIDDQDGEIVRVAPDEIPY